MTATQRAEWPSVGQTLAPAISDQFHKIDHALDLMVDPERWGEGAEEVLLTAVEAEARSHGILTIQSWTLHRPDTDGPRLTPPTGYGSIPDRWLRALLGRLRHEDRATGHVSALQIIDRLLNVSERVDRGLDM